MAPNAGREKACNETPAPQIGAPLAYGFSAAYMTSKVGVGTPSSRPSATTLPASHGSSSRLPRNRSTAIEGIISGGKPRVLWSNLASRSAGRRDAARATHGGNLGDALLEQGEHLRIIAQFAEGQAREGYDGAVGGEQDELLPQRGEDFVAVDRVEAGALAQRMEGGAALACAAVQLAEHQAHESAGLTDHPRLGNGGADLRHAAHHGVLAEDGNQPLAGVDPVLQRDDRRVGPDERPDGGAGTLHVPQLDAEQHEIDRADAGRLVGRLGGAEMDIPARAQHAQAARAHRRQVGTARDEGHIGPGLRQRCPERSSDAASTYHRDPHCVIPCC